METRMHEATLPQGTIRYREVGSGPPIVFVHPVLSNGELWRDLVPLLADRFRCITPDLPLGGHAIPLAEGTDLTPPGLAATIVAFLDALGLDEATLVGSDTGGALCQLVVAAHPGRVTRLVLLPCDAYENFPPTFFRFLPPMVKVPGTLRVMASALRIPALARLPIAFGLLTKKGLDRDLLESMLRPMRTDPQIRRQAKAVLLGLAPHHLLDAVPRLRAYDRPVLVIWAPEDRVFPMADAERLVVDFPNARLELIDDAYTFVQIDQPERTAALIGAFVSAAPENAR